MSQTVVVARDRDEVLEGVRAMAPMLVVYAPFGLLVGAAVAASDNPVAAWLSTCSRVGRHAAARGPCGLPSLCSMCSTTAPVCWELQLWAC